MTKELQMKTSVESTISHSFLDKRKQSQNQHSTGIRYNLKSFKDAQSLRQSSNTMIARNLTKNVASVRSEAVTFDNGLYKKRDLSEIEQKGNRNFDEIRIKEQNSTDTRSYNRRNMARRKQTPKSALYQLDVSPPKTVYNDEYDEKVINAHNELQSFFSKFDNGQGKNLLNRSKVT